MGKKVTHQGAEQASQMVTMTLRRKRAGWAVLDDAGKFMPNLAEKSIHSSIKFNSFPYKFIFYY